MCRLLELRYLHHLRIVQLHQMIHAKLHFVDVGVAECEAGEEETNWELGNLLGNNDVYGIQDNI